MASVEKKYGNTQKKFGARHFSLGIVGPAHRARHHGVHGLTASPQASHLVIHRTGPKLPWIKSENEWREFFFDEFGRGFPDALHGGKKKSREHGTHQNECPSTLRDVSKTAQGPVIFLKWGPKINFCLRQAMQLHPSGKCTAASGNGAERFRRVSSIDPCIFSSIRVFLIMFRWHCF